MSLSARRKSRRRAPSSSNSFAPILRIACGQTNSITGSDMPVWGADTGYNGGTADATTNAIDLFGVSNPAPMSIYQHERWINGALTYTFSGLTPNASYALRLHFAEAYYTTANKRIMNFAVNGTTQITGFDIYTRAGGMHKATTQQLAVTATSGGVVTLTLTATSTGNDPKINGIELSGTVTKDDTPTNLTASPAATSVTLAWNAPVFPTGTITGYNVYQGTTKLNSSPITITTYKPGQDSAALTPSTQYSFTVRTVVGGVERNGMSVSSSTTSGQTTGPQQTTASFVGSMGQTINYGIRFPNDYYTSGKQYPVIYSLHGRDDNYAGFLDTAVAAIRPSIDAGVLSEGIIVTPDSFGTGRWEDGGLGPAETNLLELIPYIESHYTVKPGAAWRLLTGFSMGGHGAFLHGVKHRDLFAGVWSVDGAMSYNSGDYTQFAAGKTTADFHIRTLGGNLNGSRVQTVINAFTSIGITIPYVFYGVDHTFALLAEADRNAGSPDIRFLQSRLGITP